jgi:hypothetical protein
MQVHTSGTLLGTDYTDALTTIRLVGDTGTVAGTSISTNSAGVFTFSVAGIGSGTFNEAVYLMDNHGGSVVAFASDYGLIAGVSDSLFSTYNLRGALGPVTSSTAHPGGLPSLSVKSGAASGWWDIASYGSSTTFTAVMAPEPVSGGLTCFALVGLGWAYRRRRA